MRRKIEKEIMMKFLSVAEYQFWIRLLTVLEKRKKDMNLLIKEMHKILTG